ncbi:MAG TPA: GGDEF domain-containing protein [Thermomicrobiales bacterium]
MEARVAALWPIVAELGRAASSSTEKLPLLRAVLARLATICEGSVELWHIGGGSASQDDGWRLLVAERSASLEVPLALLAPPLDDTIRNAALSRRTIVVAEPVPALAIPFNVGERVQGVLLIRATSLSSALFDWREPLEQFTPLLGLAIAALDLHRVPPALAPADPPTVPLRQSPIGEQLEQELARARRNRRAFAVLMISLDRYPDPIGIVGSDLRERVLRQLETVLRETCRNSDVVGRYDRDRLLFLLPDSSAQGAAHVTQRQLDYLYSRPLRLPGYDPLYLDVSIGIALFPVDGLTASELIENAANALATAQLLGGRRAVAA